MNVTKEEMAIVQDYINNHKEEAQEWIDEYLKEIITDVHKFQTAHRSIVNDYIDAGLLPVYTAGFITTDKQFCTLGINGQVEAAELLGYDISDANEDYMNWLSHMLSVFKELNADAKKKYGIKFNTECVPAENLAVKNSKWDKKSGFKVPRKVYSSYSYDPANSKTSIIDKFKLHGGVIAQSMDGGQALHLNLSQLPDKEFFMWLRDLSCKTGCNYWTTNVKTTCCNDCGNIDFRTLDKCPVCGSTNLDMATRIIGYCTKIKSYSADRQEEEATRIYH